MALCTNCAARAYYDGTGDTSVFTIPFTYLDPSEIQVAVYDESTQDYEPVSNWRFENRATITIDPPPSVNLVIYRCTDLDQPASEFKPGDYIRAEDLNDNFTQVRNAIDEVRCSVANDIIGEKGAPGSDGTDGAPGSKGQKGEKGQTGAPSTIEGPQGEKGAQGSQGIQGVKGDQGPQGVKGQQGIQGQQGVQGPAGAGINFRGQVDFVPSGPGDVTTLNGTTFTPQQADAVIYVGADTVVYTADDSLFVFDGIDWVDGGSIQGPQGIQGEQGVEGPQGEKGSPGSEGAQGVKGDIGPKGAPGDSVKGEPGESIKGEPGESIKGDKGDPGETTGGDVSSVNGQKGDVILGIQDMDDYLAPSTDPPFQYTTTWRGGGTTSSTYDEPGENHIRNGTSSYNQLRMNAIDANGVDTLQAKTDEAVSLNGSASGVTFFTQYYDGDPWIQRTGDVIADTFNQGVVISSVSPPFVAATSIPVFQFSYNDPSSGRPLTDGDVIAWDANVGKYTPTPIDDLVETIEGPKGEKGEPGDPATGAVTSVNGQSGDVVLGIQDMDDFDIPGGSKFGWSIHTTSVDSEGDWYGSNSSNTYFYAVTEGVDLTSAFQSVEAGTTYTLEFTDTGALTVTYTIEASGPFTQSGSRFNSLLTSTEGVNVSAQINAYADKTLPIYLSGGPFSSGSGTLQDGDLIIWNAASGNFNPAQPGDVITGVEGPQGVKGDKGEPGKDGTSVKGDKGEPGDEGQAGSQGPAGPTAVSADADNFATLGSDNLIYVPQPPPSSASLELEWIFVDGAVGPAPNYWQTDNNVNTASVSEIYLSTIVYPNRQIQNILELIDTGIRIYIQQRDNEANYLNLDVTGPAVDNGTYFTIPVSAYDNGEPFDVGTFCSFLMFQLGSGDTGGGGGSSKINPQFTYVDKTLVRIDYDDNSHKTFQYNGQDQLIKLEEFADNSLVLTKDFVYNADGTLASISQS